MHCYNKWNFAQSLCTKEIVYDVKNVTLHQ